MKHRRWLALAVCAAGLPACSLLGSGDAVCDSEAAGRAMRAAYAQSRNVAVDAVSMPNERSRQGEDQAGSPVCTAVLISPPKRERVSFALTQDRADPSRMVAVVQRAEALADVPRLLPAGAAPAGPDAAPGGGVVAGVMDGQVPVDGGTEVVTEAGTDLGAQMPTAPEAIAAAPAESAPAAPVAQAPAPTAAAPQYRTSFNCGGRLNNTESTICGSSSLAARDLVIAERYEQQLDEYPQDREELRAAQRDWLASRNACGRDARCIGRKYDERLRAIDNYVSSAQRAAQREAEEAERIAREQAIRYPLSARLHDRDGFVIMRTGPHERYELLARLPSGDTVRTFEQSGDWWEVQTENGVVGYVRRTKMRDLR
jgi:uncharacterized protein